MRTKKIKLHQAYSMQNGICFYSKRHPDYVAVATIDEQDHVTSEWMLKDVFKLTQEEAFEKKDSKFTLTEKVFILCLFLFLFFIGKLVYPFVCAHQLLCLRLCLFFASFVLLYLFRLAVLQQDDNTSRFHAAEHMIVNAYQKLNRVPTLDELSHFSRFHYNCGTNIATMVFLLIPVALCTFIPNALYRSLGICIVAILYNIFLRCNLLNCFQFFTTLPPTDKELMVAIAGLTTWYENEKKEKENLSFLHRLLSRVFS